MISDEHGQPAIGLNQTNNILKPIEHLLGICRGITFDNELNDREIIALDTWIRNHEVAICESSVGRMVSRKVSAVMADGVITEEERAELLEVLTNVIGGGLDSDSGAGGLSIVSRSAVVGRVNFESMNFVVTGKFLFGPRKKVEAAICERGGLMLPSVNRKTNYLVVGTMGSRDWLHSTFGTKYEEAMALQGRGSPIVILNEPDWSDML